MKKSLAGVLAVLSLGLAFAAGSWVTWRSVGTPKSSGEHAILGYTCPMHPAYRSDRPGDCPSCGMRLERVATASVEKPASSAGVSPLAAGSVLFLLLPMIPDFALVRDKATGWRRFGPQPTGSIYRTRSWRRMISQRN